MSAKIGGFKSSPGPWQALKPGTVVPGYHVSARIVCDHFTGRSSFDDPSEEDLGLIAAAPDLLSALVAAEKALNNIRCCCQHTAWDVTGPAVIAARAAIGKATGASA